MMTPADIEAVDPVLGDDGRSVFFYGHTRDEDVTFLWSVSLPMVIEEDKLLIEEWREVGWLHWMKQSAGRDGLSQE
ncbi:hypothetical protein [Rhizobium giardinii]|uniref:Uncharacterized protein n=1 Tax=Rhizobium giardinii TaxID=56731 RepID=A0A7W8UCH3_9HYPH|nr:hypothetical protein [Rhizobium giardinii]MBB5536836.1 hypothetical protein [Rhizobium giardinii]